MPYILQRVGIRNKLMTGKVQQIGCDSCLVDFGCILDDWFNIPRIAWECKYDELRLPIDVIVRNFIIKLLK